MAAWRMAMRGRFDEDENWTDPPNELWPECYRLRVAAITYGPIRDVNFDEYAQFDQVPGWAELAPARKQSLQRFVWEMKVGNIIYVKQGPEIVGKDIIEGDYRFDLEGELAEFGFRWRHQRRVRWFPDFQPVRIQIGKPQIVAVVPLDAADVERVEQAQTS